MSTKCPGRLRPLAVGVAWHSKTAQHRLTIGRFVWRPPSAPGAIKPSSGRYTLDVDFLRDGTSSLGALQSTLVDGDVQAAAQILPWSGGMRILYTEQTRPFQPTAKLVAAVSSATPGAGAVLDTTFAAGGIFSSGPVHHGRSDVSVYSGWQQHVVGCFDEGHRSAGRGHVARRPIVRRHRALGQWQLGQHDRAGTNGTGRLV